MKCTQCGTENPQGTSFCSSCGAPLPKEENGTDLFTGAQQTPAPAPQPQQTVIPDNYKPISPIGYVGYMVLFSIPLIGFIMLLVFAFGGSNKNVKNYARGTLILMIIIVVVSVLLSVVFGVSLSNLNTN